MRILSAYQFTNNPTYIYVVGVLRPLEGLNVP